MAGATHSARNLSFGRRAAARAALLVVSTAVTLLAAEWLVRALLPQFDPTVQVRLEQHGDLMLGPPNTSSRQSKNTGDYDVMVHFGPRGFRDARDVAGARAGDILVAGDSFAFGWGVQERERFSNRLENALHRRVFNIGMPGQDLDGDARDVRYAEQLGARAGELVLALCMENDVGAYEPDAPATQEPASPSADFIDAFATALLEHSALRQLGTAAVHRTPWLEKLAVRAGLMRPNLAGVGRHSFTNTEVAATADRIVALARGYRTTVLIVPSRGLWLEPSRTTERTLHDALVAALRARGIGVADPRAAFEATSAPLGVHFAKDGHWNARAHAIAAQVLADVLSGTHAR